MKRPIVLAAFVLMTLGLLGSDGRGQGDHHNKHIDQCVKACSICMRECESCARHCADLIAAGKKEHVKTLGTCSDCAEFCAAAARIVAHRGPMMNLVCDACAKACDVCGKACEEFASDEHMARCAKACRDCAKECRQMLQHTGQ